MAKLALDLSQFKSAGVYTIEIDQSERITVTTQSLRLVPGFSKVGPFNTPVFVRSTRDRQKYYGELDLKLERKGSFFHRSIDTCLLQSPVFAISLLKANESPDSSTNKDKVDAIAFSVDTSTANKSIVSDLFINFYNRERFWKADPKYLQGVITNKYLSGSEESAPLLQLANVGTRDISFIVRKAVGLQGYSVFAKDWYGADTNIPFEWIRPYDLMKDYFIQIIAVEGDWTNYKKLSTDPFFADYFSINGILPNKLTDFINLNNVTLIGSWTGTIIPEFRDQTGANQYIEDIVNSSTPLTGVLLNVNNEALDQLIWDETQGEWELGDGSATAAAAFVVDLVGHNLIGYYTGDASVSVHKTFLSYDISTMDASILHNSIAITQVGSTGKMFYADSCTGAAYLTVGTLVKKDNDGGLIPNGVTYITAKVYDGSVYQYQTAEPIYNYLSGATTVISQKPIDDASITSAYKFIQLDGLNITNNHLPGYDTNGAPSTEEGVEKIYAMLEDPGIIRGLTNPDMIQYRYVVDTMAYGLRPELGGKAHLSRLAKKRGKTTALISAPSMSQLSAAQNPYFCDMFIPGVDPKPIFDTRWIPQGGNPDMPRSFRFSFPTEDNGSRYCGVFGPFLKYVDNDKTFLVPPAADISNTFVRKFLGGDPFAIVANKNGIISNANVGGVEYNLDQQDRDSLEPFGYNSIIERPQTAQVLIYSNRTSFQTVKSDYNYLHVRELLNTIEIQVEDVLKQFVFDYNNPVSRLNVVNSVTPILESIKDAGALYDYEIVMDETNNTKELIDEGFGMIDIGVWINKGMEKIINRITVNKLGTASSGGFTTV
jgi:hypothetical protein